MKKIILAFMLCLVVVFIGILSWQTNSVDVFSERIGPSETEKNIISITLKNLDLGKWEGSAKLTHRIIYGDIVGDALDEMIVALTFGKDRGVLAVYSKNGDNYKLITSLTQLAPITDLKVKHLPGLKNKALIIEENLDEMFGAFYKVKTLAIYSFKEKSLQKLWEREIYRKEYFPEGYKLEGKNTIWLMKEESSSVSFNEKGDIEVTGELLLSKEKGKGNIDDQYQLISKDKIKEFYLWNKQLQKYKRILLLN